VEHFATITSIFLQSDFCCVSIIRITKVLERILDKKIDRIEFPEYEKTVDPQKIDAKGIRVDIYCSEEASILNTGGRFDLPFTIRHPKVPHFSSIARRKARFPFKYLVIFQIRQFMYVIIIIVNFKCSLDVS